MCITITWLYVTDTKSCNDFLLDNVISCNCVSFFITQGQFWPAGIVVACVCLSMCPYVRQPWACPAWIGQCPQDNFFWSIQARITEFGPEVQNTLVNIHIVLGVIDINR